MPRFTIFSGSVGADQGHNFTLPDFEVDAEKGFDLAVTRFQGIDGQH